MEKNRSTRRFRVAVIVLSLSLYVLACALPAVMFNFFCNDCEARGLSLLIWGWAAGGAEALPWLSNFTWFAGLLLLGFGRTGWAWGISALGLLCACRVLLPYPSLIFLEAKYWWLISQTTLVVGCGLVSAWTWTKAPKVQDTSILLENLTSN